MSHTLTYHSIQNVQLRHHHIGRGIGPYAHAYTPTPTQAYAPAPRGRTHIHPCACTCLCNRTAPAVFCGGLYQCHPQNDNPEEAESFHGLAGEVKPLLYIKTG
ncbi:hypothetical protein O181_109578 [Austropuccinia psidii MF-1]|uniref:Uncharacterized protein n=1 Tax=Austropuccinia psidii MF-1 TaxID=1389203 RepID=A0A9Q3JWA6_9BASI|nr:hypothetical protein [Austropuccinia psidii MF-1]